MLFSRHLIAENTLPNSVNSEKADNKIVEKTELPEPCQQLFKEGEILIAEVEKQPGTHLQVQPLKDKFSSFKQQLLKMDISLQQKSCDKGLVDLNNIKQKY